VSLPVIVRPLAERDLLEAQDWYRQKHPDLGARFRSSIDDVFSLLAESPLIFPSVLRDARRAAVQHFPYIIYYVVRRNRILILGCFHARRDPRVVLRRIGGEA
jgi:plasmid stabilization system protein ParE